MCRANLSLAEHIAKPVSFSAYVRMDTYVLLFTTKPHVPTHPHTQTLMVRCICLPSVVYMCALCMCLAYNAYLGLISVSRFTCVRCCICRLPSQYTYVCLLHFAIHIISSSISIVVYTITHSVCTYLQRSSCCLVCVKKPVSHINQIISITLF